MVPQILEVPSGNPDELVLPDKNLVTPSTGLVTPSTGLTVPSAKPVMTREDVLRMIVGLRLNPILRRQHLKREVIIGLVGLRGDGKSGSGAVIALLDYMLSNNPVWSNMAIQTAIKVEDSTAIELTHGALRRGGLVPYASKELDKEGLLRFDPQYHDGCYFIDEINMEFAEARRAMSNTNLFMDRVAQQLRKYQNSLIYTVINEMFVDGRIRELTDIFIRCEDTALSIDGLEHHKPTGVDFKWTIYPMSGYLCGRENSYYVTKRPLPPVYLHFEPFRGIYNDKQAQAVGKMKYGVQFTSQDGEGDMSMSMGMEQSAGIKGKVDEWGWLENMVNTKMLKIDSNGIQQEWIPQNEVMSYDEVREHHLSRTEVTHLLKELFQIENKWTSVDGKKCTAYRMPLYAQLTNAGEGQMS